MGRRAILIDKPKFDEGVLPNGLDIFFGESSLAVFLSPSRPYSPSAPPRSFTTAGKSRSTTVA